MCEVVETLKDINSAEYGDTHVSILPKYISTCLLLLFIASKLNEPWPPKQQSQKLKKWCQVDTSQMDILALDDTVGGQHMKNQNRGYLTERTMLKNDEEPYYIHGRPSLRAFLLFFGAWGAYGV